DRLARRGVLFANAYVQQALCGPSRASVLTGVRPDRNRVWDLHTDFRASAPDLMSMPQYLIARGYRSESIGKIYHNESTSPNHDGQSWTAEHFVQPASYRPMYGIPPFAYWQDPRSAPHIAQLMAEARLQGKESEEEQMKYALAKFRPSTEAAEVPDEAYPDGFIAQEAIRRLGQYKTAPEPFFLAVGFIKPHLPFTAPQKYWDLYDRQSIALEPFQAVAEGAPSQAYHSFGELRAYSDIEDSLDVGDVLPTDQQRALIHGYMACVSYVDAQLGKILDALDSLKMTKNTLIVLWGDHGFHLGDHTIWCKHSNLEQAVRAPLLFAGPKIPKNKRRDAPVEMLDIFPTIFDVAGLPFPSQCQGKSLMPLMAGKKDAPEYAVSQYPRGKQIMGYSLRTQRYRYTAWYSCKYTEGQSPLDGRLLAVELYDYLFDPQETVNLAGKLEVEAELREKLRTYFQNNSNK
ncbi:MAG TPA: sulfatase, partial [Saprospiraceae bacterium]|nr:sulfatase [Saprospiraceae bacterium]